MTPKHFGNDGGWPMQAPRALFNALSHRARQRTDSWQKKSGKVAHSKDIQEAA